ADTAGKCATCYAMQIDVADKMSIAERYIGDLGVTQSQARGAPAIDDGRSRQHWNLAFLIGSIHRVEWCSRGSRGATLKTHSSDDFAVLEVDDCQTTPGISVEHACRERKISDELQSLACYA